MSWEERYGLVGYDDPVDELFVGLLWMEKTMKKTCKDLARIASVLSPSQKANLAQEFVEIRGALQEVIEQARAIPPNPDAPKHHPKTKKEYAKIWRDMKAAKRAERTRELYAVAERIKEGLRRGESDAQISAAVEQIKREMWTPKRAQQARELHAIKERIKERIKEGLRRGESRSQIIAAVEQIKREIAEGKSH